MQHRKQQIVMPRKVNIIGSVGKGVFQNPAFFNVFGKMPESPCRSRRVTKKGGFKNEHYQKQGFQYS